MKLTHPTIKVANQIFDVPKDLIESGQVKFNEEGIADVSKKLGEYMINAGFEEVGNKIQAPAQDIPETEQPEIPETEQPETAKADKKSKKGKEKPKTVTTSEEPKE